MKKTTDELRNAAREAVQMLPNGTALQQCKAAFHLLYDDAPYEHESASSIRYHVDNARNGIVKGKRGGLKYNQENQQRAEQMVTMRQAGLTFQRIAEHFGISKAAVHSIVKRYCARLAKENI